MVEPGSRACRRSVAALAILGLCSGAQPALANAITDVDSALLAAIRTAAPSPPLSSRDIAMVSIAMYDAVDATTGLYDQPYSYQGPAISGLSAEASAYAAGYGMLSSLFPTQLSTFQTLEAASLTNLGLGTAQLASSVSFGSSIATSFYAARAIDGSATAQTPYMPGSQPGSYQFTATGQTAIVEPGWGSVTPFGISSVASVSPPPLWGSGTAYADEAAYLASAQFQSDLTTLQTTGCTTCGQTKDELDLTAFWSDTNGNAKFKSTSTPPGHWLDITDAVAQTAGLDLIDTARLTALVGTSLADAGIVAWSVKDSSDFWRPDTAIHALLDPAWKPLWPDPLFQSYISGHSTFSMAAATALSTFFGTDDVSFCSDADPDSHDANNQPISTTIYATPVVTTYEDPYGGTYAVTATSASRRCYNSFSSAAYEAGLSRVLGGIHFPTDNVEGLDAGAAVALDVAADEFAVPEPASAVLVAAGLLGLFGTRTRWRTRRDAVMPAAGATSRKTVAAAFIMVSLAVSPAWAEQPRYPCLIEPFRDIKLATPSSGVLEQVMVDRGDTVAKGQLVARLTSAIEEAELSSAQIKARDDSNIQSKLAKRQLAEARWARLRNLTGEAKFVSQAQLEQAESEALQARAEVLQAQTERQLAAVEVEHAQAKLAQRRIVSPFDGVVSKRDLSEGEFGYEQQPVLSLVQLDPLSVELFLPVSEYGTLHEGDEMRIDPQAPIGGHYVGKVSVIDRAFDSKSGTFGVRISLPNPNRALPSGIRCTASNSQ